MSKFPKTHIFPAGSVSVSEEWLQLSDEEMTKKFRDSLPSSFCGRRTAPAINETLVRRSKRTDYYCQTCLGIYDRRHPQPRAKVLQMPKSR